MPLFRGLGLALMVSAVVVALTRWLAARWAGATAAGSWAAALGLAAGYAAGFALLAGWPEFPPAEADGWLPYLAAAGLLVGGIEARIGVPPWGRWVLRLLLVGFLLWCSLPPAEDRRWAAVRAVCLGAALLALWGILDAGLRRLPGVTLPLLVIVVVGGLGGVLLISGSLYYGPLAGLVVGPVVPVLGLTAREPGLKPARGLLPVALAVLGALLLDGSFYSEVPTPVALLMAVAPTAVWIGALPRARSLGRWPVALLSAAAVLVPVAVALALAVGASPSLGPPDPSEY